jgi:hypothetical protein
MRKRTMLIVTRMVRREECSSKSPESKMSSPKEEMMIAIFTEFKYLNIDLSVTG